MRRIFINARIFDGTGAPSFGGEVVIEGERIAAVAHAPQTSPRQPGDIVVDAAGATLMPGLVEAHAHLSWPSSVEKIYHSLVLPPDEMQVAITRNARVLLDHGFTSAYSAGALADRLEVDLRDAIKAGRIPGPRLRASTIERSPEGGEGIETGNVEHGRGPEAMTAFVAHCAEIGIDNLKLVLSGEDALLPGSSQTILYTEDEVEAAAAAARANGLWISAHTQASEAVQMALRHGVRVLYHCTYADPSAIEALVAQRENIFMAPAIGIIVATLEANPPPHVDMTGMKAAAVPVVERARALIPELKRRGVRILPGGDYGFPFNPNGRNARDLEHFVNLFGYTPAEALHAATGLGGELMGMGDELGLIRPGYLADLLLVDGDPTENISILQDKSKLLIILQEGKIHKQADSVKEEYVN